MRRRSFLSQSVGGAGLMCLVGCQRQERPTSFLPAGTSTHSTTFPLAENPISEGGAWTNGGRVGLDWQDIRTDRGLAFGVAPSTGYNDCIACLSGLRSIRHVVRATVRKRPRYRPPSTHEVELLVGFTIADRVARGYEINFGYGLNVQVVRWNGPLSDFTPNGNADWLDVGTGFGCPSGLMDGDVIGATYDASSGSVLITLHLNGRPIFSVKDTGPRAVTIGAPGMGFFARSGPGLEMSAYSLRNLTTA
jgi:hypothetical protein